jgi:hypothetical protein
MEDMDGKKERVAPKEGENGREEGGKEDIDEDHC